MNVKKYSVLLIAMLPLFTGTGFLSSEKALPAKKEVLSAMFADNWTGIISYTYTIIDKRLTEGEIKTEFELVRNTQIIITATGNRKGHATINHTMKRREKSDAPFGAQRYIQITEAKETSIDEGNVDVDIEPNYDNKKYNLKTGGPLYEVETTSSFWTNTAGYGLGPPQTSTSNADGIPIDAPDQSFGKNPNEISGSYVIFSSGTHYVAVSWKLSNTKRSVTNTGKPSPGNTSNNNNTNQSNSSLPKPPSKSTSNQNTSKKNQSGVELIVTPEHYEDWKPSGGDPGNKQKIGLLLRSAGTQPPPKAIFFELKLFSTSRKGSLTSDGTDSPDIRFLPHQNAVLGDDRQFIKIPCLDGINGQVFIGSYDDKASTILVAEAILDNGTRIRGVLFSQGLTEIPIPKQQAMIDK